MQTVDVAPFTDRLEVTFHLDNCTIATTVSDPDVDDRDYVVREASAFIRGEYGIDPADVAQRIVVTNKYGELIEGN